MRQRRGITLLELMIVMLVVSLLVGISYPSIGAGLDSLKLRSQADRAAAILTQGITRVERTQSPMELLIDRSARRIVLRDFSGRFTRELLLEPGVEIRAILPPIPAPGPESSRLILLAPGEPFPSIGVLLSGARGRMKRVRIDPLAAMAVVETPAESVSGEETH